MKRYFVIVLILMLTACNSTGDKNNAAGSSFSANAPDWVKSRVERAYKVAFGSEAPILENIWVLLPPNCPGMPALPRLIRVEVLDNRGSSDIVPDNLLRLLSFGVQGGGA